MEEEQVRILRQLLEETSLSTDDEDTDDKSSMYEGDDQDVNGDETHQIHFYNDPEDNPFQVMDVNTNDHIYQVLGNEIILISKGEGICCLCQSCTTILYCDNSYGNNIPAQLCKGCIQNIFSQPDQEEEEEIKTL